MIWMMLTACDPGTNPDAEPAVAVLSALEDDVSCEGQADGYVTVDGPIGAVAVELLRCFDIAELPEDEVCRSDEDFLYQGDALDKVYVFCVDDERSYRVRWLGPF